MTTEHEIRLVKFIKEHESYCQDAFIVTGVSYRGEFKEGATIIFLARMKLGYSDKTNDCDIYHTMTSYYYRIFVKKMNYFYSSKFW